MSATDFVPGRIPQPDETHTCLVTAEGFPVKDREACAGDKYAIPPLPYRYVEYRHPKGVDAASPEAIAKEKLDREWLDLMVLDLSQTKAGRKYLTQSYDLGFGFLYDPDANTKGNSLAINDRPTKALWFQSNGYVPAMQLTAMHEMGHFLRNQPEMDAAGNQVRGPMVYTSDDCLESSIVIVRMQESSSECDAAEHAVETTFITNPNHYRPPDVFEQFARGDYRKEIAAAAVKATPLLADGKRDEFHAAVHIAFYTPKNLAYYDEAVLENLAWWTPVGEKRRFQSPPEFFMKDAAITHQDAVKYLPYLAKASYSLDEPWTRAMVENETNEKLYRKHCENCASIVEHTKYNPNYKHYFVNEISPVQAVVGADTRPTNRMLDELAIEIKPVEIKPESKLVVMPSLKELPHPMQPSVRKYG